MKLTIWDLVFCERPTHIHDHLVWVPRSIEIISIGHIVLAIWIWSSSLNIVSILGKRFVLLVNILVWVLEHWIKVSLVSHTHALDCSYQLHVFSHVAIRWRVWSMRIFYFCDVTLLNHSDRFFLATFLLRFSTWVIRRAISIAYSLLLSKEAIIKIWWLSMRHRFYFLSIAIRCICMARWWFALAGTSSGILAILSSVRNLTLGNDLCFVLFNYLSISNCFLLILLGLFPHLWELTFLHLKLQVELLFGILLKFFLFDLKLAFKDRSILFKFIDLFLKNFNVELQLLFYFDMVSNLSFILAKLLFILLWR